jgi:hypothetical protein
VRAADLYNISTLLIYQAVTAVSKSNFVIAFERLGKQFKPFVSGEGQNNAGAEWFGNLLPRKALDTVHIPRHHDKISDKCDYK